MAGTKTTSASSLSTVPDEASVPDEAWPFALTATVKNVQQLTAVNEAARREGILPGMTLTHARALIPSLPTLPADADADRLGLEKLADWCGRYSPLTGIDLAGIDARDALWGDDGLWIDASGCTHLFGGEEALLADIEHRLIRLGIRHRLGLGETPGAAWAIARHSPNLRIAEPGCLPKMLDDLPAAGLRLSPDIVTLLRRLGLKRIGQIEALPRVALGKRFSSKEAGEAVLQRLDQTYGRQDEPLVPRRPPPVHRTQEAFLEPIIELPALAHALTYLTSDLCRRLDKAGQGAMRLTLFAYRVDGDVKTLTVGASRPTRDQQHIERLFTERLETIDAGFGIEQLTLHADHVASLKAKQTSLGGGITETTDHNERLAQLIDRLVNHLGPKAVKVTVPFESHIPERADQHISVMEGGRAAGRGAPASTCVRAAGPSCPPCRPSCLLLRPEPIKALAEVPDGPPLRFTWRRVTRRIVLAEGPERIAPSWVDAIDGVNLASETRDYYRVEDDQGQRYWLFRQGLYETAECSDGNAGHQVDAVGRADRVRWFVHGLFG